MSRTLRWLVYCFVLLLMTRSPAFADGITCQPADEYLETGGYVVGNVQLDTPLSFVGAVTVKTAWQSSRRFPYRKAGSFIAATTTVAWTS